MRGLEARHLFKSSEPFKPLKENQFRLLELLPGSPGDSLQCKLVVTFFDTKKWEYSHERPSYEAVSYSWGKPEGSAPIKVNNAIIKIPPPLHEALLQLRLEDASRVLWCDAICVNQKSLVERAAQVQLMFMIFRSAKQVIAWLGLDDESGLFQRLSQLQDVPKLFASHLEDISNLKQSVLSLLQRPWFRRVWIRQEVAAASSILLQCGVNVIHFEDFFACLQDILAFPPNEPDSEISPDLLQSAAPSFLTLYNDYCLKTSVFDPIHSWLTLLYEGEAFGSSDPRDRIYAMIHLAEQTFFSKHANIDIQNSYDIDYTKTLAEVYTDFALDLASQPVGSTILWSYSSRLHSNSELPSWVPDWSLSGQRTHGFLLDRSRASKVPRTSRRNSRLKQAWTSPRDTLWPRHIIFGVEDAFGDPVQGPSSKSPRSKKVCANGQQTHRFAYGTHSGNFSLRITGRIIASNLQPRPEPKTNHASDFHHNNSSSDTSPAALYRIKPLITLLETGAYIYAEAPTILSQPSPPGLSFYVPAATQPADLLVVPEGQSFLVILRPTKAKRGQMHYEFLGAVTIFIWDDTTTGDRGGGVASHQICAEAQMVWIQKRLSSLKSKDDDDDDDSICGRAGLRLFQQFVASSEDEEEGEMGEFLLD